MSSIKTSQNAPTGVLIVSQSNTPGHVEIPFVKDEVQRVEKQLQMQGISSFTLDDKDATVNCVLEAMEKFPCIHLACHASQYIGSPLKSSIHLSDGPLELSEIIKKNLHNSDFAFLSACQTSMGDKTLPDEVVHIASGMLAAGFQSVVGSMWSVLDKHGPDLAELFYESLLNIRKNSNKEPKIDGYCAARALHNAIQRLQEKVSDSPYSFLIWVPYIHIGI